MAGHSLRGVHKSMDIGNGMIHHTACSPHRSGGVLWVCPPALTMSASILRSSTALNRPNRQRSAAGDQSALDGVRPACAPTTARSVDRLTLERGAQRVPSGACRPSVARVGLNRGHIRCRIRPKTSVRLERTGRGNYPRYSVGVPPSLTHKCFVSQTFVSETLIFHFHASGKETYCVVPKSISKSMFHHLTFQ
jgi:hypothetical protein